MVDVIMTTEEWRPITHSDGRYEASNHGNVRRSKPGQGTFIGRVLSPVLSKRKYGYLKVHWIANGKDTFYSVHQLIAEAFIGPRKEEMEVNHIDGDKTNNMAENLEYVTRAENMRHASKTGLMRGQIGVKNNKAKLTENDVRTIRKRLVLRKHGDIKKVAHEYGVTPSTISAIALGKTWAHLK